MPVLEITQLRLKGADAGDQTLLENLSTVRDRLQTNSRFYSCIEDQSLIYILGQWPTLDAHGAFLASAAREQILGPQEEQLEFRWTVHMELDSMASLPLNAPVIAIARLAVNHDCVEAYDRAAVQERHAMVEATRPYNLVHGWRCDGVPGQYEALLFTGWENMQAHAAFLDATKPTELPATHARYNMHVHHAFDLEARRTNQDSRMVSLG